MTPPLPVKIAGEAVMLGQTKEGTGTFPVCLSPLTLIFTVPERLVRKVLLIWVLATGL